MHIDIHSKYKYSGGGALRCSISGVLMPAVQRASVQKDLFHVSNSSDICTMMIIQSPTGFRESNLKYQTFIHNYQYLLQTTFQGPVSYMQESLMPISFLFVSECIE